ncbi:MAG TPA: M48 family metalloprotease [Mariprofundaceae bacterium]|nr:M48 family metalloprotease [Mariprofundaceae bacterium]
MKRFALVACILVCPALILGGCATNPVSKHSEFVLMSEKDELALGAAAAAQVARNMPLLPDDDPLVRYVDRVGQRVAKVSDRPELFYRFHVVDDAEINAFALPGGYIYVDRGLLTHMNSEAELAAVLGHEIGHVTARHAVQQYTKAQAYNLGMAVASIFVPVPYGADQLGNLLATAIITGYGREDELQADQLSIKYITAAGYDPNATAGILRTLKRLEDIQAKEQKDTTGKAPEEYHGAFSTHPETEKRILEAVAAAKQEPHGPEETDRLAMLKAVDGYPYGDSPDQGAVVGQHFLHPKLGIQIRFSDDWVIQNSPQALTAQKRQQKVYFQLSSKELQKHQTAADILRDIFPARHMGTVDSGVQDRFAYAHTFVTMSAPHVSNAMIDATVFLDGPRAYLMLMWCDEKDFAANQKDFSDVAYSFRSYDAKRDGGVPRIHLYTWAKGDTWQGLAARSHLILGRFTADKLAALNGMGLNELPAVGEVIKTVR